MATIDLKLKTYEQLQFEVQKLITDKYLLEQQLEQYKNIIKEVREYIEKSDDFDIEIFDESTGGCLGTDLSKGAKHILEILDKVGD